MLTKAHVWAQWREARAELEARCGMNNPTDAEGGVLYGRLQALAWVLDNWER